MSNTPPCCPIERFIEHSAEHFISPAEETFEQLAARRAGNLDLMIRYLHTLAERASNDYTRYSVSRAIDALTESMGHLRSAAAAGR